MSGAPASFARLFNPRAIAVVGASSNPQRIGGQPLRILRDTGYRGGIFPVNPKYGDIDGIRCFRNLASVPYPCDLALIAVNARLTPQVVSDCGKAGIPFAIVFSAGFRETGESGTRLEKELRTAARDSGVRFIGPNCIGVMNLKERVYCGFGAGFANPNLKNGPIAFVSQSGGFAFSVVGLAEFEGIGFNYVVSVGNEADISTLDLLEYFLEREDVEVLVTYLEGIGDGHRLREIGRRALALGKPIVTWKVGNSDVGRMAAESHTASMTASYTLYRAAFEEGGFLEISDVHDLVDVCRAFNGHRLPKGPNVAVVTTSGGSGVLIADTCDKRGLRLPELAPATVSAIQRLSPQHSSLANPVDLTAQITGDHERVNQICERVLADPGIDQLVVRYGAAQGAGSESWAEGLAAIAKNTHKPVLVAWSRVPDRSHAALQVLERTGIPWLLTPTRAANAAGALYEFARKHSAYAARPAKQDARRDAPRPLDLPQRPRVLSEHQSKLCLARYEIPVVREIFLSLNEIERITAVPLHLPVAVKVDSPDVPHKTEADAVRLNVPSLAELKIAAREVVAAALRYKPGAEIHGVLVGEMVQGTEVVIGAVNDRFFGPVVMFGLGGVYAELLKDVSYRFAPFDTETAHAMIREIRAHPVLTGHRGKPALAVEALAAALSRVSLLVADHADLIAEIDINPLFVNAEGVAAADALVVLQE